MQISPASQNWLFHVAAQANAGGGHVARSLVLAREMQGHVTFSMAADSPYTDLVAAAGFDIIALEDEQVRYDGIWVDSYQADFDRYRQKADHLVLIEDHKDLYDEADIYVRPYPGDFENHKNTDILSGFDYAFIDPKYFDVNSGKQVGEVKILSVFMGRYDSVNATQRVLESLKCLPGDFTAQIVMGTKAAHRESVEDYLQSQYKRPYTLMIDCSDLCEVYKNTDLMVLSGGVAVLEACAAGVPSVVLNIADNQQPLSRYLADKNMISYVGSFTEFDTTAFTNTVAEAMGEMVRRELAANLPGPLTPYGARNVATILNGVVIREAVHA